MNSLSSVPIEAPTLPIPLPPLTFLQGGTPGEQNALAIALGNIDNDLMVFPIDSTIMFGLLHMFGIPNDINLLNVDRKDSESLLRKWPEGPGIFTLADRIKTLLENNFGGDVLAELVVTEIAVTLQTWPRCLVVGSDLTNTKSLIKHFGGANSLLIYLDHTMPTTNHPSGARAISLAHITNLDQRVGELRHKLEGGATI